MSIVDELSRLSELRDHGAITDDEFETAKSELLHPSNDHKTIPDDVTSLRKQVDRLHLEQEVIRLDREWEEERQQYTIHTRYGTQAPNVIDSITIAIILIIAGICILAIFSNVSQHVTPSGITVSVDGITKDCNDPDLPEASRYICDQELPKSVRSRSASTSGGNSRDLLALFGVGAIILGVATGISGYSKATAYDEAYAAYQQRRSEILAKLGRDD